MSDQNKASKLQLAERFEFWITTNGYNAARELAAFPKGGRRRIYVNPTVELAWQAVEAMHEPQVETSGEPVAYVPVHPRNGPLWSNVVTSKDAERPAHYPLMPLFASPAPETPAERIHLPKITPDLVEQFGGAYTLMDVEPSFESGYDWSQVAVDFACMLKGAAMCSALAPEAAPREVIGHDELADEAAGADRLRSAQKAAALSETTTELREESEYYKHNRDVMNGEWVKLRDLLIRFVTSWESLPGHENMDRLCEIARGYGCGPLPVKTGADPHG